MEKPKPKQIALDHARYLKLEKVAHERRKDTGRSINYMDVLRDLIDKFL